MPYLPKERRTIDWWPMFVREMFAVIGAALNGKPLDPNVAYDIQGPWPDHRIKISYIGPEELAEDGENVTEGLYVVQTVGKPLGGGRWEFLADDLEFLASEALRNCPPRSNCAPKIAPQ